MCSLSKTDVWLLLILAVFLAAVLVTSKKCESAAKLGAFFTVLGDAIALLVLCCDEPEAVSE